MIRTLPSLLTLLALATCSSSNSSTDQQCRRTVASSGDGLHVLVVGGSDGSGTRGIVALLERLGVGVVYDDPVSRDVHGAEVGGWPAVVAPLLRAAAALGTADRKGPASCSAPIDALFPPRAAAPLPPPSPLPPSPTSSQYAAVSAATTASLMRLVQAAAAKRAALPPAPTDVRGGEADGVSSGGHTTWRKPDLVIKAPVAMVLVPHFLQLTASGAAAFSSLGGAGSGAPSPPLSKGVASLRFLHVVRDGRDIAFSKNQSPVQKFFNATFSSSPSTSRSSGDGDDEAAVCWGPSSFLSSSELGRLPSPFDDDATAKPLRAARLWAEWNSAIFRWSRSCAMEAEAAAAEAGARSGHPIFGYMAVRVEDLLPALSPTSSSSSSSSSSGQSAACPLARERAITKLARFAGVFPEASSGSGQEAGSAAPSEEELCCACHEPLVDLGASIDFAALVRRLSDPGAGPETEAGDKIGLVGVAVDGTGADDASPQLSYAESLGYGKWRRRVAALDSADGISPGGFSGALYAVTASTLSLFGYGNGIPARSDSGGGDGGDTEKSVCRGGVGGGNRCAMAAMKQIQRHGGEGIRWAGEGCEFIGHYIAVTLSGGGSAGEVHRATTARECCGLCRRLGADICRHFTFIHGSCTTTPGGPNEFQRNAAATSGWLIK